MRKLTGLTIAFGFGLLVGCADDPPPPKPAPVEEEPAPVEEPVHPLMKLRQAYGLPFPPEVTSVHKNGNFIEVGTKLQIPELEKFFRGRLVDYEFVNLSANDLRIVGLHSTMPRIFISKRAPGVPIFVRYVQQVSAIAKQDDRPRKVEAPIPGKPVTTKLGDGTELAPGAVYGQPYTPQPGDPLYKARYRANFGKPFGTWVLN